MILWGAIWGALVGYLTSRGDASAGAVGAALGAMAGASLRSVMRKEIARFLPSQGVAEPASAKARATTAAAPPPGQTDLPTLLPTESGASPVAMPTPTSSPTPALAPAAMANPAAATAPAPIARAAAPIMDAPGDESYTPGPIQRTVEPGWAGQLLARARDWLLGGNTIVRLGLLVLFIGLAFLAKYAAEHSLLPPELRLAGIGISGIVLFVLGLRVQRRLPERSGYALSLQGGGIAVLYLTVFSAFRLYQFLPAGAAFVGLAVICALATAIALLQNALPMAFIGFAGAFAAPLLVSTGQGNHVALFSYYLLLGVAIAVIAWLRAWRALNLLGFLATFGVATFWGVLQYRPEQFASTQPFLIAFFLIYLVASVLYATRHALAPRQAVDTTLIFALPLVAFGLQAGLVRTFEYATGFSSLMLGAFYLALGAWALRRARTDNGVGRWLAECFVALGLGFVTLAVPLALDPRWTSAVWAAEGAAIYWIGRRQQRTRARAVGLALQVLGALAYLGSLDNIDPAPWPLANPAFVGAALLAASALILAHWCRDAHPNGRSAWGRRLAGLEVALAAPLFWVGFLWAQFALGQEVTRMGFDAQGRVQRALDPLLYNRLHMLGWLLGAFAAHWVALPARRRPWRIAATPAWFSMPIMLLVALDTVTLGRSGFSQGGWWIWPVALALHIPVLMRLDSGPGPGPQRLWSWIHSAGVWLLVLLGGKLLYEGVEQAELFRTAWASVILLVSATAVLLLLARRSYYDPASAPRLRWPLRDFARAYLWRAAAPLAALVAFGSLAVALLSDGNAAPLPYVALLNPTDLAVALGLTACAIWWSRVRHAGFAATGMGALRDVPLLLSGIAFIGINTVWLRIAHHYAGVRWNAQALFDSFLVQAGYSILWTLLALALMLTAHRRQIRPPWMAGAALLGATVIKLFLIDLSNRGGAERIVVFIAVGVLMLVVGYFAPLPPRSARVQNAPMHQPATPEPRP